MAKVGNPQTNKIDRYLTYTESNTTASSAFTVELNGFLKQFNYLITPSNPLYMTVTGLVLYVEPEIITETSGTSDPTHPTETVQGAYQPAYELYITDSGMSSTQNTMASIPTVNGPRYGTFLAQVISTGTQGDSVSSYKLSHSNTFCCTGNHNASDWGIVIYNTTGALITDWDFVSITFHFYQL